MKPESANPPAARGFVIKSRYAARIKWSRRGSCGNAGCKDPECCCSLCGQPIGVPEEDPRWDAHPEYCGDCDLCRDRVPIQMFRGEGKATEQAQFHTRCFEQILFVREGCQPAPTDTGALPAKPDKPGETA
jgi:hypothetical protein